MKDVLRIYIAGPMTGLEDSNRRAFYDAAALIASWGHIPVHTADMPLGLPYERYIDESLERLSKCDAIYLLDGFKDSYGVMRYELPYAKRRGFKIFTQSEVEESPLMDFRKVGGENA